MAKYSPKALYTKDTSFKPMRLKLDWCTAFSEKYGSPKNLVDLFNKSPHIKEGLKNGLLFGECFRYSRYYKTKKKIDNFLINSDYIGFRITKIKYNKKQDACFIDVIPVKPHGNCLNKDLLESGFYRLHPHVPNVGTEKCKMLIPVTFYLIEMPEPIAAYSIECKYINEKPKKQIYKNRCSY